MKKIFSMLLMLMLVSTQAFASVGLKSAGTMLGSATDIDFSSGTNVSFNGSTAVITVGSGGTITGAVIDSSVIGGSTPAAGSFTTLTNTGLRTGTGKDILNGSRSAITGYEYYSIIQGYLTGTGTSGKTHGLYINLVRESTSATTVGDLEDQGIKIAVKNEAVNTAGNTLKGLESKARNGATGTITNLDGGLFSAQTDSGGTTGSVKSLRVESTLNGTVTDLHIPLDVRAFRQSAGVPTTEAICRLRNGNTSGTGITGLRFESEAGTPAYFTDVIDISNANVNATGSDVVLSSGAKIYSGTAVTRAAVRALVGDTAPQGSIFIALASVATTKPNMYIKVLNAGNDSDWERIVTQASD
jgi:hypothetical protein